MTTMMKAALAAGGALVLAFCATTAQAGDDAIIAAAKQAETSLGAHIGIAVLDMAGRRNRFYNADRRFAMASTFKTLACAHLLDKGAAFVQRPVMIARDDILSYAPITKTMVGQSVTAGELCAITLRSSDNTAANKVLDVVGGPATVTQFLRRIGDSTTRLDRMEPALNEAKPGDERDTSTPRAMARTMQVLLLGKGLKAPERETLKGWLMANEGSAPLLRAGLPQDWVIADRTGAGGFGTRAIVAVMWPPQRAPLVVAIYITGTGASMDARNKAIATIGHAIGQVIADETQ